MSTTGSAVAFDPFEPGFVESPYEQYARLRAHDPVHRSSLLEGWVLTRFADVTAVLRDPSMSSDLTNAAPTALVRAERERQAASGRRPSTLVLRDEPDHGRLRRLMQAPFGPRAIAGLRIMVERRVAAALDAVVDRGEIDLIDDFAYPLPVGVFCEMLGIPDEDSPRFREWTQAVARNLDPLLPDDERQRCMALHDEMEAYLEELIEVKRARPGDDVMTQLVHAEDGGERLSREELVAQLVTLYVAGHEPTTALIGNGVVALLRHPDQLAAVQSAAVGGDDERLSGAVHELLRYDGPNQFVRRVATRSLPLGPATLEPGDLVYVGVAAANRDPQRWGPTADAVDVARPDAAQHVQFGAGVHTCLGSHLARLQAETALRALLARVTDLELAGEPAWSERMVLRSVQRLPIRFRPRAGAGEWA